MWVEANYRQQLYEVLKLVKERDSAEYVSGKEQFRGPGWYWVETRSLHFSGTVDRVTVALTAEERIGGLIQEMRDLAAKLREARIATRV